MKHERLILTWSYTLFKNEAEHHWEFKLLPSSYHSSCKFFFHPTSQNFFGIKSVTSWCCCWVTVIILSYYSNRSFIEKWMQCRITSEIHRSCYTEIWLVAPWVPIITNITVITAWNTVRMQEIIVSMITMTVLIVFLGKMWFTRPRLFGVRWLVDHVLSVCVHVCWLWEIVMLRFWTWQFKGLWIIWKRYKKVKKGSDQGTITLTALYIINIPWI